MNDWTVMIFMSGDNNLAVECVWGIKEILRVGLPPGVAVTVQFDSITEGPKRYDIKGILEKPAGRMTAKGQMEGIDRDGEFLDLGETVRNGKKSSRSDDAELMASPKSLKEFLEYSIDKHKADRYLLVLSGHGSGIVGDQFLFDEQPENFLSIPNLKKVMLEVSQSRLQGKPFDILGMDACSMNMAEVGFELRGAANYLVGAEGFEETTGWPYYRILETLKRSNKPMKAEELAEAIVKIYTSYYLDYATAGISTDIAYCDLGEAAALADAIRDLGKVLSSKVRLYDSKVGRQVRASIVAAHWETQSYMFEDYVDLWDFCDRLHLSSGRLDKPHREDIQKHCRKVKKVIEKKYVKASCYSGAAFQHSHGVSIYLPWVENEGDLKKYRNAERKEGYSYHTRWGDFIKTYVDSTRRDERNKGKGKFRRQGVTDDGTVMGALEVRTHPERGRTHPERGKGFRRKVARVKNPALDFYQVECGRKNRID